MQSQSYLNGLSAIVGSGESALWSRSGRTDHVHRRQKAVTLAGYGFNEAWILRVVLQRGTQFLQRRVKASLEIAVRAFRPKGLPPFRPLHYFPIMLEDNYEVAKGLFLKLDPNPLPPPD